MINFHYQDNEFYAENIPIHKIIKKYGTPTYIYSRTALKTAWKSFNSACQNYPHHICYAVKANSNLAVLQTFAELGSGFDIVSGGELEKVLKAGGKADSIIFSGVGKQNAEIKQALHAGIQCFDVESASELERIETIAKSLNKIAPISLRINPDLSIKTHPYIATASAENKFGIHFSDVVELYLKAHKSKHLKIKGIACHIGSQITELEPFLAALDHLIEINKQLSQQHIHLSHVNIGGGLGVGYHDEITPSINDYCTAIIAKLKHSNLKLIMEPGRALVAEAGILVTKIEYIKHTNSKNFAIVDAAMNDLLRPSLYNAWHGIIPIKIKHKVIAQMYDVVGPVCESSDFLGKNRHLAIQEKDLLAICTTGAYGSVMSSNYNSRPRAAEIMVEDDQFICISKREKSKDLYKREKLFC